MNRDSDQKKIAPPHSSAASPAKGFWAACAGQFRERWDFLLPLIVLICFQAPLFSPSFWYDGDTIYSYHLFYGFYANFYFFHDLTHWLPYGSFGIPADYLQLDYLSPANFFSGLTGWLFRITRTDLLYKGAILFEHVVMLLGMNALLRRLFRDKIAIAFSSLIVMGSSLWLINGLWNFRFSYMIPLIFYLILEFERTGKLRFLGMSLCAFVLAQIGVPIQFVTVILPVSLIFFLGALLRRPWREKLIERITVADVLWTVCGALLACAYLYFVFHIFDHVASDIPGRTAGALSVSLKDFLTYGPAVGKTKFLTLLFGGYLPFSTSLYIGLLPLIFVLISFLNPRAHGYRRIVAVTLFLILLSLGGESPVAAWIYALFPPIRFFRYVGAVGVLLRPLLAILAGYGMDYFLATAARRHVKASLMLAGAGMLVAVFCITALPAQNLLKGWTLWPLLFRGAAMLTVLGITAAIVLQSGVRIRAAMLLLYYIAEIFLFQNFYIRTWPHRWNWVNVDAFKADRFSYQEKREVRENLTPRMIEAEKVLAASPFRLATEAYSFELFDPCLPQKYPQFHWSSGVDMLIRTRFASYHDGGAAGFLADPNTQIFFDLFGCSAPKMRILSHATPASSTDDALAKTREIFKLQDAMVLENPMGTPETASDNQAPEELAPPQITSFTFNKIEVRVTVPQTGSYWLYYADAYHPGWHASIDDRPVPLLRANLAFKAVRLKPGTQKVTFHFWDGLQTSSSTLLVMSGVLFCLIMLGWILNRCFVPEKDKRAFPV